MMGTGNISPAECEGYYRCQRVSILILASYNGPEPVVNCTDLHLQDQKFPKIKAFDFI